MFSIQTNVNALVAQENLRLNGDFQSHTIQRLTSGYRINQSGDDAAGLAVANKFRSDVAELSQGVRNANDGLSTLQIVDGGLNNISKILDRLKTLATQSASTTFTGDRTTLNNEYQSLLSEIDRQASNVGLVKDGRQNAAISVYIGGGSSSANAAISVDLSGASNRVDSGSLGVGATNIVGSSAGFSSNTQLLTNSGAYLNNSSGSQVFTFGDYENTGTSTFAVTVTSNSTSGITANQALSQLNSQLSSHNIQAVIDSNNKLAFTGNVAFSVSATNATGNALVTGGQSTVNTTMYNMGNSAVSLTTFNPSTTLSVQFTNANGTATVVLSNGTADTAAHAINAINNATKALGIYAIEDKSAANGISIQSSLDFNVSSLGGTNLTTDQGSMFGITAGSAAGTLALTANTDATTSTTANATVALQTITSAVQALGQVQGKVGSAQNKLNYAIQLAQSQISAFSAAESRIRDADVAQEAANLTKAQVLQQASIAAMAQANSAPQAVLSLLRG